jgi:hypothetical protein
MIGGQMFDFISDILIEVILAIVVDGATLFREHHLPAKEIPDRATPIRRRNQLRWEAAKKHGIDKQHFIQKMRKAHIE